jgi:L-cysteate sulfo-lyase
MRLNSEIDKVLANSARIELAHLPTPLQRLDRLSAHLGGPTIYIKRDDCTGLAGGGNKTRKLEFLMAAAKADDALSVVTIGGIQSNHCRQTAAAAAKLGLECHVALIDKVNWQDPAYRLAGNVTLDHVLGAHVHVYADVFDRDDVRDYLMRMVGNQGKLPYFIPLGGSNVIGALGYVAAFGELNDQLADAELSPKALYFCTSSGGTHAGLAAGSIISGRPFPIIGVHNEEDPTSIQTTVEELVDGMLEHLGVNITRTSDDVQVLSGYGEPSYGIPNAKGNAAIALMAQQEGILLDPVYTGKAFAGLIGDIEAGKLKKGDDVVFLHTGGAQALGAYSSLFVDKT